MQKKPHVLFAGSLGKHTNVKYAYMQAVAQDYGFQPVFAATRTDYALLQGAGLPVAGSPQELAAAVQQARCIVLDNFALHSALQGIPLTGKRILQLWHGIPLKKIGFPEMESAVNMTSDKGRFLEANYSGMAAVPCTSPWMKEELFSRAFRAEDFPVLGFPCTDVLQRLPSKHDMLGADVALYAALARHRKGGGKVMVYMPTFRDTGGNAIEDGALDPTALDHFCRRNNILLVLKFHPLVPVEAIRQLDGLVVHASAQDIYPLLPLTDALITDYSSIYFDYLLVDKPLIFFPYDKEKYLTRDRELFFDYEAMTPGMHVRTMDALMAALLRVAAQDVGAADMRAEERRALRDKLFAQRDGRAAHRVCAYIKDTLLE